MEHINYLQMSSLNIIRQILLNSFQMDHNTFIIAYCILYTAIHSILVSILCRYTNPAQPHATTL